MGLVAGLPCAVNHPQHGTGQATDFSVTSTRLCFSCSGCVGEARKAGEGSEGSSSSRTSNGPGGGGPRSREETPKELWRGGKRSRATRTRGSGLLLTCPLALRVLGTAGMSEEGLVTSWGATHPFSGSRRKKSKAADVVGKGREESTRAWGWGCGV